MRQLRCGGGVATESMQQQQQQQQKEEETEESDDADDGGWTRALFAYANEFASADNSFSSSAQDQHSNEGGQDQRSNEGGQSLQSQNHVSSVSFDNSSSSQRLQPGDPGRPFGSKRAKAVAQETESRKAIHAEIQKLEEFEAATVSRCMDAAIGAANKHCQRLTEEFQVFLTECRQLFEGTMKQRRVKFGSWPSSPNQHADTDAAAAAAADTDDVPAATDADAAASGHSALTAGVLRLDDAVLQPEDYEAECRQKAAAKRARKAEAKQLKENSQRTLKAEQKLARQEQRKLQADERQKAKKSRLPKKVTFKNRVKNLESHQNAQPSLEQSAESQFALYDQYQDDMCTWLTDVHRRDTLQQRGLGIFATRDIPAGKPVAKYQGHLVHPDGSIAINCTLTSILFLSIPHLDALPFSRAHCASVFGRGTTLTLREIDCDTLSRF